MGREISLFADFTQKENRITNYCGLMLKFLYNENPDAFEFVINSMLEDIQIKVNPGFVQQEKKLHSIPDLCIRQSSFEIYFETKIVDWFYSEQIEKHINGFAESKSDIKILFLVCNDTIESYEKRFEETINYAKTNSILIKPITFEGLLECLKLNEFKVSDAYNDMLIEFGNYLDKSNLLPSWKSRLDVISCGATYDEIEKGYYSCPNIGKSYSHRRAKYFGAYLGKKVVCIAEIRAIIAVGYVEGIIQYKHMIYKNSEESDKKLQEEATNKINTTIDSRKEEMQKYDFKIFLLGEIHPTSFIKESKGGLYGSKTYFENIPKKISNAKELAEFLDRKEWGSWESIIK